MIPDGNDLRSMGLNGARGLVTAVIRQALLDALDDAEPEERASAWAYMAGPVYEDHVTYLDLPADVLPEVIEELASEEESVEVLANV